MYHLVLLLLWTGLAAGFFTGCAARQPEETKEETPPPKNLAVLPVEERVIPNEPTVNAYRLRTGAEVLDSLLREYFGDSDRITMVTGNQMLAMAPEAVKSRPALARAVGRELQADGVLLTLIERYLERQGTEYTVENPASVAFSYQLIDVATGKILCTGAVDETQQPLFENLFSFPKARQRGFKWVTAGRLARDGLWEILGECEPLQSLR